jgi:hypothetical protein
MKKDDGESEQLFVIRTLSLIRHSSFELRHFAMELLLATALRPFAAAIERAKDIGRIPLPLIYPRG